MSRYNNILETVGNTPVVKINKIGPKNVNLFVKVESFNPLGSVKDRLALGIIEDAERSGKLKPGQTVIEASSGNTGIGLSMVCAQKGYPLVVVMSENCSIERRKIMRFLGARVVLTPAAEKGIGMTKKAEELAEKHGWYLTRQFENEANANIHSETTAEEILKDFKEDGLDYWVSGFGTGGTLKGVARVLREKSPKTKIIACEPDNSQMIGSGISQDRNTNGTPVGSHPNFRPHLMQGWSPDFIPKLAGDSTDSKWIDETMPISGGGSLECAMGLAQKEGIFVGISGGATFYGALKIAEKAPDGSNILCMLPDTGERYLSTPLFYDIEEDMSDEEVEISKSSPNFRFDIKSAPKADDEKVKAPVVEPTKEAVDFVENVLVQKEKPVVMFAMEWCEFCWSNRKLFKKLGIDYESVDLDSVKFQENDMGGKIRAALNAKTGWVTIPQIFVGGEFVGGCTDTFDSFNEGKFQQLLEKYGVPYNKELKLDPYSLLPGWLNKTK